MSGFWSFRRLVTCSILAAAVGTAGLVYGQSTQPSAPLPPGPTSIATINGREINSQFFYGTLMQIDGMRVFEKVRDLALVQNECLTNGIGIGDSGESAAVADDFKKRFKGEFDRFWDTLKIQGLPEGKVLSDEEKQNIIGRVLTQRGGNLIEFKLSLETSAGLRALAKGKVDVTDQEIQNEYDGEYGEVLHCLVFVVPNDPAVQAKVREAIAKGTSPDDVAKDLKLNPPATATLPKFLQGKDTSKFTQAAFLLKLHELSPATEVPTQAGQPQALGMIYLSSIDPDRRASNPLSKVRDELKQKVFNAKQEQWMNNHLIMLRANAAITINDPVLKSQYQAIAEAISEQAKAAASQPGGAPTTAPASGGATPAHAAPAGGAVPPLPSLPGNLPPAR